MAHSDAAQPSGGPRLDLSSAPRLTEDELARAPDVMLADVVQILVVVPRAGHRAGRDQPDGYHDAVDAFLTEVA